MNDTINWLIAKTINSDYFKSWALAQLRGYIATGGGALVAYGFLDNNTQAKVTGALIALAVYYLQHIDVKVVDGKIKIALLTAVPVVPVTVEPLPDIK